MSENKHTVLHHLAGELRRDLPAPFPAAEYEARWERVRDAMA